MWSRVESRESRANEMQRARGARPSDEARRRGMADAKAGIENAAVRKRKVVSCGDRRGEEGYDGDEERGHGEAER